MNSVQLSLSADVQERISGWLRIQERLGTPAGVKTRPTLTLSRQFGCEGFPVAERVQELFQASTGETWTVFDKTLIDTLTREAGISRRVLEDLGDVTRALEAFGFHPRGAVTTEEAYAKMALLITQVAKKGNAIVVGRGGAILCQGLDNAFHFRLEAGFAWRVESLARRMGLSKREAAARVTTQSRLRDRFIRETLGHEVGDPLNYDAIFNNERHSVATIAQAIFAYVQAAWLERPADR